MIAVTRVNDEPSPAPGASAQAIDIQHLFRMTLGELSLQREVLELFDRQADILLPRIRRGAPAVATASAHTLKGSAVSIGAFKVARAAEAVEQARGCGIADATVAAAMETLAAVLDETKAEIARLLRA